MTQLENRPVHVPPDPLDLIASGPGSTSMTKVYAELDKVAAIAPAWHAEFEETDLFNLDNLALVALLDTAPTNTARAFLAGVMAARLHLFNVTAREIF
jgi:hypothetical protein